MVEIKHKLVALLDEVRRSSAPLDWQIPLAAYQFSSLQTVSLWLGIKKTFRLSLAMQDLLDMPSLNHLAESIHAHCLNTPDASTAQGCLESTQPAPALPPVLDTHAPFALTPIQQSYFMARQDEQDPDAVGCNLYREFSLDSPDLVRLQAAWHQVLAHQPMLRVRFVPEGRQSILPEVPATDMPCRTLVHGDNVESAIQATRSRLMRWRFAPGQAGFVIEVTRLPDDDTIVHFCIDGMLTDGVGLALVMQQWRHVYQQADARLPELPCSVPAALLELDARRQDAGYALDLAYWQQRLHAMPGAPKLVQPAQDDLGNHGSQSGVSNQNRQSQLSKNASHSALPASLPRQTLSRRIDAITWASLQQQASTLGISPTSLVLAVFADCLYQASSQQAFSLVLTTNHRPWLKYQAQGLMGPFTSSMVFVPGHDDGISLSQYAQAVHAALWQDISHGAVDGIAALRQLRKAGGQVSALPVVFTSMLDLASQLPAAHAMDEQLRHECSITSGVALEHEIREQQGALLLRWDVDIARFPLHQMEALFARYVNLLASLPQVAFGVASARAGQLQQAYLVARSAGSEGCQIYQSFHMPSVDVPRLQHAMLRLINHFEVLRTTLQANGQLSVMPEAPSEFFICEVDLASQSDAAGYLAACRQAMLETSFAPGRWPQFELRVTRDASNGATVHCAFDLALQDAVSILQLPRQLLALYSDPAIQLPDQLPGAQLQHAKNLIDSSPAQANLHAYWEQRLQDLPPGPVWAAPQQERQRLRLEGQLREWPHLRQRIEAAGVSVDAWFSAVLIEVLGTWPSADFGLTVVRWPSAHEPWRPAELTGLSWLSSAAASGQAKLMSRARAHHALFSSEAPAIAAPGLASLRKMLAKRAQPFALPLVYTGVFDMALPALPPGVRSGAWQTCTPEVSLDVVSLVDGERLQFFWDVVENDFPPGQIRAMFGRYQEVLQALACQDCDWEKFDMSIYAAPTGAAWPDPEREKILYGWNQTAANYPIDQLPYQLIENQAACQPQAIALRGKQGSQSFSELNQYANHLAWQLKDAGVKRETLVAICVHPGFLMVAAVLAIHKAGGAYLPLDPTLPPERMATILHEAGVAHVIVDQAAMPPLFSHQVQIMAFAQTLPASLDPRSLHNPPCVATVANSAYIIYTSGSTGKPKGVLVAHQALLNLLNWANKEFAFDQKDCGLAVASLGFDLSVFDLFGLLGSGASLYVADATERKDPTLLLDILLQHPITFWNSSPAALHQLGTLLPGVRNAAGREYLRLVFLSGDFTPLSLPDEVRATFPHATIINLGGATEATVWSNYFRVGAIDDNWRSIPYGIPIDNARYHVLDDDLEPCRVGVEGDLYIGGDCLSIGYWQQGALTAKSFVPDPYAKTPGQRLYRTGDRVAYLPDGNLTFIGRIDGQVKIRGNRVELGEIDFQLRSHPAIKEALTLARDDHTGDRKLVAYVIAKRERPAAKTLREHVAKTLPAYMVPNFVCFIDAFPSTANGKLDRNALPWPVPREETPASAPPVATTQPELPTLEALMQTLQQLFAEQLMSGSIGIDSDLWDFGATSFTLIQVSNSLQKQYGCRVPVSSGGGGHCARNCHDLAAHVARWAQGGWGRGYTCSGRYYHRQRYRCWRRSPYRYDIGFQHGRQRQLRQYGNCRYQHYPQRQPHINWRCRSDSVAYAVGYPRCGRYTVASRVD
jgi:amino acid adenylation domain-containing protein